MKQYDIYKDSGIEWIGEIPDHWEAIPMRFLLRQKITDGPHETPKFLSDGIPFLSVDGIQDGELTFEGCRKISIEDHKRFKQKCTVEKYDILMGKAASVGKVAQVKVDFEFSIWSPLALLKPNHKKITSSYFEYFLKSSYAKDNANILSTFNTQQNISMTDIPRIYYILPISIDEQTAIANYLDRKTVEIEALITDKKRLLELYEEEKTAVISQAVTKGIDPNAKMKDSGIEWLGEIPKHWEVKRLKYIAKVQTGRTPKIQSSQIDFFENGNINWFTPADFDGNNKLLGSKRLITAEAIEKNEVELFPEFSIYLVSIGATLGKVSYFDKEASANQQINIISFDKGKYNPIFGYYYLIGNKEMIALEADYTTLPILNQSKTKNLIFVAPSIKEQQSIVRHIETECARIDTKIEKTKKLIELLTEYRTALISEVITGKIKVID